MKYRICIVDGLLPNTFNYYIEQRRSFFGLKYWDKLTYWDGVKYRANNYGSVENAKAYIDYLLKKDNPKYIEYP